MPVSEPRGFDGDRGDECEAAPAVGMASSWLAKPGTLKVADLEPQAMTNLS